MAWVRLDDQFFLHAKVTEVSNDACLLYLVALTQCNLALTDGVLTPTRLHICASARNLADEQALAAELVAARLWERVRGGWCIHDYSRYQPTSTVIKKRRAADAQRQAERRERKRAEAEAADADYVERHAVTHAGQTESVQRESAAPNPNPNPNPPLVNAPLPPTSVVAEQDEARAPEPERLRAVPKPREVERAQLEAHPLFEPLVTLFGPTACDLAGWHDHLAALDSMGALPEDVPRAAVQYARIMGTDDTGRPILLTPKALVKHWRRCVDTVDEPGPPTSLYDPWEAPIASWVRRYDIVQTDTRTPEQREEEVRALEREMGITHDDVTRHAATQ